MSPDLIDVLIAEYVVPFTDYLGHDRAFSLDNEELREYCLSNYDQTLIDDPRLLVENLSMLAKKFIAIESCKGEVIFPDIA